MLSVPSHIPAKAHLETAISVYPEFWYRVPPYNVTFEIAVTSESHHEQLFSRTLNTSNVLQDRGWIDVEVSLAAYAGQEVTLEFSTSTDRATGEHLEVGGWELPRLVADSPTAHAGPGE